MKLLLAALLALLSGCAWHARGPVPLLLAFADGTCSGTAIAPHVVLTATHCFGNGSKLQALTIEQRIDDDHDHTLLVVAETFDAHASIAPMPKMGAAVQMVGNPGDLRSLYAVGTVAGTYKDNTLLNLPIFYGDSGAAVMDEQGRIVGVVSGIRVLDADGVHVQWGEVMPLAFTAEQWRAAGIE